MSIRLLRLQAEDENGQKMTDEELWEDVHDIMGAGAAVCLSPCSQLAFCLVSFSGTFAHILADTCSTS